MIFAAISEALRRRGWPKAHATSFATGFVGMERADACRLLCVQGLVRLPDLDAQVETVEALADLLEGPDEPRAGPSLGVIE